MQVKRWRRDLHKWDPAVGEDEEVIEVRSSLHDIQSLRSVLTSSTRKSNNTPVSRFLSLLSHICDW